MLGKNLQKLYDLKTKSGLRESELCLTLPSEVMATPRELDLSCDHACAPYFFSDAICEWTYILIEKNS